MGLVRIRIWREGRDDTSIYYLLMILFFSRDDTSISDLLMILYCSSYIIIIELSRCTMPLLSSCTSSAPKQTTICILNLLL